MTEGLATRSDDLVWRVRLRHSGDWLYLYLLIEFQSRDDPTMAIRVMTYLGLLYQSLLRHRFGALPEAVMKPVEAGSAADVERWALGVLDSGTLEEVFAEPS